MEGTAEVYYSADDTSYLNSDRSGIVEKYLEDSCTDLDVETKFREFSNENSLDTAETSEAKTLVKPRLPTFHIPRETKQVVFHAIQEWEGHVNEVFDDYFTAKLVDVTADESIASEEADFPIEDVTHTDLPLLKPGGVFRWSIGYLRSPGGTKKRVSQIVFRRLPQWTKKSIAKAEELAKDLSASIDWK